MDSEKIKAANIEEIIRRYNKKGNFHLILQNAAHSSITKATVAIKWTDKLAKPLVLKIGLYPGSNEKILHEVKILEKLNNRHERWTQVLPNFYESGWLMNGHAYSLQEMFADSIDPFVDRNRHIPFFDGKRIKTFGKKKFQEPCVKNVLEVVKHIINLTHISTTRFYFEKNLWNWFKNLVKIGEREFREYLKRWRVPNYLDGYSCKVSLVHGELAPRHIIFTKKNGKEIMKWIDWEYSMFDGPWFFDLIYFYISCYSEIHNLRPSTGAAEGTRRLLSKSDPLAVNVLSLYRVLSESIRNTADIKRDLLIVLLCLLKRDIEIHFFDKSRSWEILRAIEICLHNAS